MTPEEFKEKMILLNDDRDIEYSHIKADELMCDILRELGYSEGVEIFENMHKWYA